MASQTFSFTSFFLFYLLSRGSSNQIKCGNRILNLALVYDCRYNLPLQQTFFTQFLKSFLPLNWILNFTQTTERETTFNITQLTYTESNLLPLNKFTQENFTLDKFEGSLIKLKSHFCPRHFGLNTVFSDTRDETGQFLEGNGIVRTLAIFVLDENMVEGTSDDDVLRGLESQQDFKYDVCRLFVVIKPQLKSNIRGKYTLFTKSLTKTFEVVKDAIRMICIPCFRTFEGEIQSKGCYNFRVNPKVESFMMTANGANDFCDRKWIGSHLVYINSQKELEHLLSDEGIIDHFTSRSFTMREDNTGVKLGSVRFTNELNTINLTGFIGLSGKSSEASENYTWMDGTPLVINSPWSFMNEGKGCVYMSANYVITDNVVNMEHHEWSEIDCKKTKDVNFIMCELQMVDENEQLMTLNEFKNKENKASLNLLYASTLNLFFSFNSNDSKNTIVKLFKHKLQFKNNMHTCHHKNQKANFTRGNSNNAMKPSDYILKVILKIQNTCELFPHTTISPLLNGSYHAHMGIRNDSRYTQFSSISAYDSTHIKHQLSHVTKCLYESDTYRRRIEFQNNSYLQDCEKCVCPPGFIKCPFSYCIPAYLVNDDSKDCPHGEDEMYVKGTKLCARKFKFTLRNSCLHQGINSSNSNDFNTPKDYICQVPCEQDYNCLSNIVRTEIDNEPTFQVSYIETTVEVYEEFGLFKFTPQIYSLFLFNKLVDLDLNDCKISDLDVVIRTLDVSDIRFLDVSNNEIVASRHFSIIQGMKDLQILNMSYNKKLYIDEKFILPSQLQVLDLSHTKCGSGLLNDLVYLTNLKILVLIRIQPMFIRPTGNLKLDVLDLRGTKLVDIKYGYLWSISIQSALYTDDYRICCDIIRGPNIPENKCHALRDALSTCQDLIGNPLKRFILWLVGVSSVIGNMSVVIYRLIWDRAILKKAYGHYVVYLGISDFIMGVYMLMIAWADSLYRNKYVLADSSWRNSLMCRIAGILSTFSSETSTIFICLITLDRFLVIRYPFGEHRISKIGKVVSLCFTLFAGAIVSVIPALFPDWEIYSYNGMCLALPFSSGSYIGWEFSALIFIGLNFILFILIAIGQLAIFLTLSSYKNNIANVKTGNSRKTQEISVARQLFLVALSDFCCWFPIGIMGLMSMRGFEFNLEVYAWTAVVILPVNSAINPLIYTLPAMGKRMFLKQ